MAVWQGDEQFRICVETQRPGHPGWRAGNSIGVHGI